MKILSVKKVKEREELNEVHYKVKVEFDYDEIDYVLNPRRKDGMDTLTEEVWNILVKKFSKKMKLLDSEYLVDYWKQATGKLKVDFYLIVNKRRDTEILYNPQDAGITFKQMEEGGLI